MFAAYPQHIHTIQFEIHYLVYWICCLYMLPLHNVIFFHNDCTINSTQNVYSISSTYTYGICLQLHYPVYWICCLYMLPLHNVIFFHNYCTIDSTTMSTAYPQHIHIVLFTTTLQCILALLFIYAFLFTMWYFFTITAQFTLQQCLQHILNIYIQYYLQLHYPVH